MYFITLVFKFRHEHRSITENKTNCSYFGYTGNIIENEAFRSFTNRGNEGKGPILTHEDGNNFTEAKCVHLLGGQVHLFHASKFTMHQRILEDLGHLEMMKYPLGERLIRKADVSLLLK